MYQTLQRRSLVLSAVALAAARLSHATEAASQLRIYTPYGPGGAGDTVARGLGERLSSILKVPVIVDNKPGASGSLGLSQGLKAAPDGSSITLVASSPLTILPHLLKLPYDSQRDVAYIAPVMISPVLLVATSAFKGKNVEDLISLARKKPDSISIASPGQGTVGHLVIASLGLSHNVKFLHVPYKDAGQRTTDAIGGVFDLMVDNPSGALIQQINAGKLRVLAISAPTRLADFPNVPTLKELGVKDSQLYTTWGVVGPVGLSSDQRTKFNQAVSQATTTPEFSKLVAANYGIQASGTSAEYEASLQAERQTAARVIKGAGIQLDQLPTQSRQRGLTSA